MFQLTIAKKDRVHS